MDSQSQANPWISDRSLGTVGVALQCAEQTGVIGKVGFMIIGVELRIMSIFIYLLCI